MLRRFLQLQDLESEGTVGAVGPPRGYPFPAPRDAKPHDAPAGAEAHELTLWRLLGPYTPRPILLAGVPADRGYLNVTVNATHEPVYEPVRLDLRARAEDLEVVLHRLRELRGVLKEGKKRDTRSGRHPSSADVWGRKFTPTEAIALVDHLAAGLSVEEWVERRLEKGPELRRSMRSKSAHAAAHELAQRMLAALLDPLAPLRRR